MTKQKRRERKRKTGQRLVLGLSFLFFSAILFINNFTQLLQTYNIPLTQRQLTLVAFIGVVASAVWAVTLAAMGEFS
jgi:hypothetical protein